MNPGRRLELLGRSPAFRLLFGATLASGLGTWLAFVALMVDVWDRTGSSVWVSALLAADFLPLVAIGLLAAPLVDRLSRKRVMVVSDLVRAAVFLAIPFAGGPGTIVALAAVAGFASGFFRPAVYAGVPNLVDEDDLPQANSLLQAIENLSWMLTPPLAGLLIGLWGTDPAYVVNALSFLVSAALLARVSGARLQAGVAASRGHIGDIVDGFTAIVRTRALLAVFIAWNVFFVAIAGVNVAEIALAKVALDSGDFGYGLLVGATGVGLVIGSYLAATITERAPMPFVYGTSIALIALGVGVGAVSPSVWLAAASLVVVGFGNGVAVVCNSLFVQRGAPDAMRGRVFTVLMSSNYAVLGLTMAAAGPLTDAIGPRWVWGIAAWVAAGAAVAAYALTPGARAVQGTRPLRTEQAA